MTEATTKGKKLSRA